MIVVEKNPLEDLRVLRNVDMVIVQGKVIRAPKVKKKQIVGDGAGQISEIRMERQCLFP